MSGQMEIHLAGRRSAFAVGVVALFLAAASGAIGVLFATSPDHVLVALLVLLMCAVCASMGVLSILGSANNTRGWIGGDRIEWERGFGARWLALPPLLFSSVEAVIVNESIHRLVFSTNRTEGSILEELTMREPEFSVAVWRLRSLLPGVEWIDSRESDAVRRIFRKASDRMTARRGL